MKIDVGYVKLKLSSTVSYIKVLTALGRFVLLRRPQSETAVEDDAAKFVSKLFEENPSFRDEVVSVFDKAVEEIAAVSSQVGLSVGTARDNSAVASEILTRTLVKALVDEVFVSQDVATAWDAVRSFDESAAAVESEFGAFVSDKGTVATVSAVVDTLAAALNTNKSDGATTLDTARLSLATLVAHDAVIGSFVSTYVDKPTLSLASGSDQFAYIAAFVRQFTDAATAEESVVLSAAAVLSNSTASTDALAVLVATPTTSEFVALDLVAYQTAKPLLDGASLGSFSTTELGKHLFDSVAVSGALSNVLDVGITLDDLLAAAESELSLIGVDKGNVLAASTVQDQASLLANFDRAFINTGSVDDSLVTFISKSLFDSVGAVDLVTTVSVTNLTLSELLAAAESELSLIGVDKGNVLAASTVQDFVDIIPNLGKNELADAFDSGVLYNQGYCDIDYFAEDYVGDVRTF